MQTKQRRVAQEASKVKMHKFYEGDKVLPRNEKAGKFDPVWVGPYVIVEVDPSGFNVIIEITKNKRVKFHVNGLRSIYLRICM